MSASSLASPPWLNVIMPIYRGEQWLDGALASIASEGADGIEILMLDSSPTSASSDIARSYSDRLNLRLFERPDLTMWHTKTNAAIEMAAADHICWLHHDDLWLPGRINAIRSWIETDPDVSLHLAPSKIIDRSGRTLGTWRCPLPEGAVSSSLVMERLLVQNFISAPAPVFRKDAWLASGGLDPTLWYTADWDIWMSLASAGSVRYHDAVTTAFRIHGQSQTVMGSRDAVDFTAQMQTVFDRHLPRLPVPNKDIERAGRASIKVNTALASAAAGDYSRLLPALRDLLQLGPGGLHRYLRDSRLWDRVQPRMRAKLMGAF